MFEISTGGSTMGQPEAGSDSEEQGLLDPRWPGCRGGKMKNMWLTLLAVATSFLLMPGLASGHHGWAAFDPRLTVTFKGTVTDFHFVNPHSVVEFGVKDDKGQVQKWQGELTSAIRLAPQGWTVTSLEAGDEITITGYRAQSGARVMRITKLLSSNGKELKLDTEIKNNHDVYQSARSPGSNAPPTRLP
jgi:uncharacterized protein DUF6152